MRWRFAIEDVTCDTEVWSGDADVRAAPSLRLLSQRLPRARQVVLAGAGHYLVFTHGQTILPRSHPAGREAVARVRGPGDVARRAGIHVETLRYYERIGLLPPPARTRAGRRLYDDETIALLQSVRLAGLRIDDILSLHASIRDDRGAHQALLASLERTLERTLSELGRLEERRLKLEAIIAQVRATPPGKDLKERLRGAWRRVEGTRRSPPKRVS
jgi:DNA-binding transcriptional MerR regulator